MKVSELIEILKQHPPDMRVVMDVDDGCYNALNRVEQRQVCANWGDWWFCDASENYAANNIQETALVLTGLL